MFERLKKLSERLLKKETEPVSSNDISRRRDLIPMPVREEFLSDPLKLEKIDELKKEYLKTLRLTRTITSVDIMPEELHDYQNIYYDLLMNIFAKESEVSFEKVDEVKDEKLELSIECYKLRLYLERVRELIIEARLRLIALNELLNEKVLSRNKKSAIINEIDNLSHIIIIFNTQELAMIKGIHSYLTSIGTLDIKTFLEKLDNPNVEEKDDNELINKRLEEVRELAILVIPDIVGYLESLNLSPKSLIAYLEQELEIYVYTHQDDLAKLREETDKIAYSLKATFIQELKGRKEEYLDRIKGLELRYKVFSLYGRNLVTYEDLEKLYEGKFCVLNSYILENINVDISKNATYTELECYQNIIVDKINRLVSGKETYVNLLADKYKIEVSEIVGVLISVFKIDDEFSYLKILNNRVLLSLLLSLNYFEDWLSEFFQNTYVKRDDYPEVDFFLELFDWDDNIPLASVCEMIYLKIRSSIMGSPSQNQLYRLYDKYKAFTYKEDEYKLSEGITSIHKVKDKYDKKCENEMLDSIYFECKDKTIVMPSTLKSITGAFFAMFRSLDVVFNDEFEAFYENSLCSFDKVRLPKGVKVIDKGAFGSDCFPTIRICDYKNSSLLNDEKLFKCFIQNCYKAYQTSKERRHFISDETRRRQELYKTGRYSSSDHSYLFDHDCTYTTFLLKPKFEELVIEDENGDGIILNLIDLTCECERCSLDYGFNSEDLKDSEVYTVMNHLKEKIAKKFAERKKVGAITKIRRG